MSVPLRCPECQDNLGKTVENSVVAYCGTCGTTFYNEDGYSDDLSKQDKEWLKKNKPKKSKFYNYVKRY